MRVPALRQGRCGRTEFGTCLHDFFHDSFERPHLEACAHYSIPFGTMQE
jgi:hypothetical protein